MPLPLGTSHLSSPVAVPNIVILKMSKFYSVRVSKFTLSMYCIGLIKTLPIVIVTLKELVKL